MTINKQSEIDKFCQDLMDIELQKERKYGIDYNSKDKVSFTDVNNELDYRNPIFVGRIYVLVYVHYDYYRFQVNYAASVDINKLKSCIPNTKFGNLPIYEYDINDDISKKLQEKETMHWWIQSFDTDVKNVDFNYLTDY